jgi:hypothetical protein
MFGYLKANTRRKLAFDGLHPKIDERRFKEHEWFDFYWDAKEAIPADMPKPRGNYMSTHCFVDASHGSDHLTRRSQTGIIIEIELLYYISTSVLKLQLMPLKSHPCVTHNHGKYSCPGS